MFSRRAAFAKLCASAMQTKLCSRSGSIGRIGKHLSGACYSYETLYFYMYATRLSSPPAQRCMWVVANAVIELGAPPRHCDDIRHIAPFQQRPRHFDFPNPAGVIAGDGSVPGDVVNRLLARRWIAGQSKRMVDLGPRRAFDRGRALQCDRLGAATDCERTRGVLYGSMPLMTAAFAHFLIAEERMTLRKLAGLAMGSCGLIIVLGPSALLGLWASATW